VFVCVCVKSLRRLKYRKIPLIKDADSDVEFT